MHSDQHNKKPPSCADMLPIGAGAPHEVEVDIPPLVVRAAGAYGTDGGDGDDDHGGG